LHLLVNNLRFLYCTEISIIVDKAKNLNTIIFTREKSELLSTKAEQLEWRRSKVTELRVRGLSYAEIAQQLQVSRTFIASDLQYIRQQAKGAIKEYVTEHLPEQYQVCLSALDTIIKNTFVVMQKTQNNREKMLAMELFKDTHLTKLELLSNATTIDSALEYIRNKGRGSNNNNNSAKQPSVSNIGNSATPQQQQQQQSNEEVEATATELQEEQAVF
jgi:hypothetical protein